MITHHINLNTLLLSAMLLSCRVAGQDLPNRGSDEATSVRNGEELRMALENDDVTRIMIVANVSLRIFNGWERDNPLSLNRSVVLEGLPDRSVKLSIRDLVIPGPDFGFLQAERPVNITFVRLHVSGVPFVAAPTGVINVSVFFVECLLEVWDINGPEKDWVVIVSRQRPKAFITEAASSADAQNLGPATKRFCESIHPFECPRTENYLVLEDVAFALNPAAAGFEPEASGVFSARDTVLAIPVVEIFNVKDSLTAGEALRSTAGDMVLLIIDEALQISSGDLPCSVADPIVLQRDVMIMGARPSVPPLDLVDFDFKVNCIVVPSGITVTFSNLLLNNTIIWTPVAADFVPWQTMLLILVAQEGAQIVMENVVWNLLYNEVLPLSPEDVLQDLTSRARPDDEVSEQMAEIKNNSFCTSEFIGRADACPRMRQCLELARCHNGAVLAKDIAFTFEGANISLLSSLLIPRQVSEFSRHPVDSSDFFQSITTTSADGGDSTKVSGLIIGILVGLGVLGLIVGVIALALRKYQKRYRQQSADKVLDEENGQMAIAVESEKKAELDDSDFKSSPIFVEEVEEGSIDTITEEMIKAQQQIVQRLFKNITLGELLGQGSYGTVYQGTWNGAVVAVKVMTHTIENERMAEQIEREVKFMTELKHPNIVHQYQAATRMFRSKSQIFQTSRSVSGSTSESSSSNKAPDSIDYTRASKPKKETWMVMEFCNVGLLSGAIREGWFFVDKTRKQLNMDWVLRTAQDIARGFEYLHENNLVHGDLKPHNILLSTSVWDERKWMAKIADFGVSRKMGPKSHIYTGTVGTMAYLSPEIMRDGRLSDKADIYAFAMIMWQLVSGESVFQEVTPADVWRMVAVEHWRPTFPQGVNQKYQLLATRCWAEDPRERPPFSEVRRELDEIFKSQ